MSGVRRAIALYMLAVVAGCYSGRGVDSPYSSSPFPVGVSVERRASDSQYIQGIYRSRPGDPQCCWLAKQAHFGVLIPANARTLRFSINIPDIAGLRHHAETVQIQIDGGPPVKFRDLLVGEHILVVPVHSKMRRIAAVDMAMSYVFVPKRAHVNGDTRELSVELHRVRPISG